jgi:hypothetical protein
MDLLLDLSDARRAVKDWLPADDRDVTNGLVVMGHDGPRCIRHGAMNRVHPIEPIYRCSEYRCGVGAYRQRIEEPCDPLTRF